MGSELENPMGWPEGQYAEEVPEILLNIEVVHSGGQHKGQPNAPCFGPCV